MASSTGGGRACVRRPARRRTFAFRIFSLRVKLAKRSVLSTEDRLTTAADNFTTGEKWPTLVLRRTPERCSFTVLHKGRPWQPTTGRRRPRPRTTPRSPHGRDPGPALRCPDPRPLIHILRATGNPPRHQSDLLAALGLPPIPAGFGSEQEILDTLPGARVLTRRGLLAGMRDTMATKDGIHPRSPATYEPRPARWWLLRVLGLLLFTAAAVYAWWTPDIGPVRSTLSSSSPCSSREVDGPCATAGPGNMSR